MTGSDQDSHNSDRFFDLVAISIDIRGNTGDVHSDPGQPGQRHDVSSARSDDLTYSPFM